MTNASIAAELTLNKAPFARKKQAALYSDGSFLHIAAKN